MEIICKAPPAAAEPLFYKFSPTLVESLGGTTIAKWRLAPYLNPVRLIPALVRYTQQRDKSGAVTENVRV